MPSGMNRDTSGVTSDEMGTDLEDVRDDLRPNVRESGIFPKAAAPGYQKPTGPRRETIVSMRAQVRPAKPSA